jgi:hypothetical protein
VGERFVGVVGHTINCLEKDSTACVDQIRNIVVAEQPILERVRFDTATRHEIPSLS